MGDGEEVGPMGGLIWWLGFCVAVSEGGKGPYYGRLS